MSACLFYTPVLNPVQSLFCALLLLGMRGSIAVSKIERGVFCRLISWFGIYAGKICKSALVAVLDCEDAHVHRVQQFQDSQAGHPTYFGSCDVGLSLRGAVHLLQATKQRVLLTSSLVRKRAENRGGKRGTSLDCQRSHHSNFWLSTNCGLV